MKRQLKRRVGVLMSFIFLITATSYSQVDNFDFLRSGAVDGIKITEAYITPWANAIGAGVNGSWYTTAKVHKLGGFDLTFGANVGIVPSSDDTFDVTKIGLTQFTGTGLAPTISGADSDGPTLSGLGVGSVAPVSFKTPPGTNWKYMPVPTLTAGIGLPLGTELKIRYIPRIPISSGDISSWGVGLVHSIMQYIPGDKILPFDVSLFGGYTKLEGNAPIDLQPDLTKPQNYSSAYPAGSFDNQNIGIDVEAWNASVIGSLNLRVLTLYGGFGYSSTRTLIRMTGNYPMPTVNTSVSATQYVYEDAGVLKGFPDIDIKNYAGLRTNIGLRLKFAFFTIHADYTWAHYSVVSTGFGFTFR